MPAVPIDPSRITSQLARICNSPQFCGAGRIRNFLQFIVTETVEGRAHHLKEYTIATMVYNRCSSFDPKADAIVRVEAIKLRVRLKAYYAEAGSADDLLIGVPKGGYAPDFQNRGLPLVSGSAGMYQLAELHDIGSLALFRRTPASIAVATDCFLQARCLNPLDARGYLGLATSYSASLDIETVSPRDVGANLEASVSHGLRLGEDLSEAHVLASIWFATNEGPGKNANDELVRAMHLNPKSPVAHFWACALQSANGAHESSLEHFEQAIRSAPACALLRAYRGRALSYAGRYRDALKVLNDVRCEDPGLAVAFVWTSLARTELGLHDEAVDAALQAVQLSETSASLSSAAYVLARAGRRVEAELILHRLCADPPYGYVSPLQLAVLADSLGREDKAADYLADARRENAWALLWQGVDCRVARLGSRSRVT
ncbi:MAG: tetratricopeptide repeat protein [Bryobacteraceae bacterium]